MKHLFKNDYSELAHPRILEAFARLGQTQQNGYSEDEISLNTADMLKDMLASPSADIHFVAGGTLANLIGLDWMLKSTGSVLAADTGHINVHEAGAIEATGHKINAVAHKRGKLDVAAMQELLDIHRHEHMVTPGVVYLSQSTELGTIYSKAEFEAIAGFCQRNRLYLFVDGARLGAAIASEDNNLQLDEMGELADMLYIGGTKNGAMFGEALAVLNEDLRPNFRGAIKQRGGLLAKGFAISAQFNELFKDGLYFDLAQHANQQAERISQGMKALGYKMFMPTQTNQVFPIMPHAVLREMQREYGFYTWQKLDEHYSATRLVTSWATPPEKVTQWLEDLAKCS